MAKHIIVVTQKFDPHADYIIWRLCQMGHEPVRLNTDDIPINALLSFEFDRTDARWQGKIAIQTNGRVIDIADIRSVWWRRPGRFVVPAQLSEQESKFAGMEISHALHGLWASLDCYWMSHPANIHAAEWKLGQLRRAAQLGLEVPRTLLTMNSKDVRAFYELCNGKIIYKVLTDPFLAAKNETVTLTQVVDGTDSQPELNLPAYHETKTTFIEEAHLTILDSIRFVPCLFQEYIPKQLELRVTVIGDEVFVGEIHSQAHERTRVDWRHYDVEIPYRKGNLPVEITERCLALVKSYGLNFSAMDFILTPDGRYVFLENNPAGQFIFMEHMIPELRMSEALATCLIRGANS